MYVKRGQVYGGPAGPQKPRALSSVLPLVDSEKHQGSSLFLSSFPGANKCKVQTRCEYRSNTEGLE